MEEPRAVVPAVPWHVLEGVPAGQEVVPGLLRGLVAATDTGSAAPDPRAAWAGLEARLGWSTGDPLFAPAAARLFELLPHLDTHRRAAVLGFLAKRAHLLRAERWRVSRQTFAAFENGRPRVVPLLADPDAGVRVGAAWFLREVPSDDRALPDRLRRLAAAETDPTALIAQLLALGTLSACAGVSAQDWLRPWQSHTDALVRLAAVSAALAAAGGTAAASAHAGGAAGLGRVAGRAFAELGVDTFPDVPWWGVATRDAVGEFADRWAADRPQEVVALVGELSGHRNVELRRAAVRAAGTLVRHWRGPAAGLWEVVAAGLDDEDWAPSDALDVLAEGGSAVAPYADRLVRFVEQAGTDTTASGVDKAVQALVGVADDRALPWYRERFGNYSLTVDAVPARWAPELLPAFRERLRGGLKGSQIPKVLHALAPWGPAAAPAVPELIGLLDTLYARPAAEILGRIGPAAAASASAAADVLARLARGDLRPPRRDDGTDREPHRWHGVQTAAWAHWRLTGDPSLALDVIGSATRAGFGRPVLSHLADLAGRADLGPLARPLADAVRPLLGCPGEWTRIGAAEAWWRLTGDTGTAVYVLMPAVRPGAEHRSTPLALRAVRALGLIGRPAAPAVPLLHALLASERRYGGSVVMDEALCRAAREALTRIG